MYKNLHSCLLRYDSAESEGYNQLLRQTCRLNLHGTELRRQERITTRSLSHCPQFPI